MKYRGAVSGQTDGMDFAIMRPKNPSTTNPPICYIYDSYIYTRSLGPFRARLLAGGPSGLLDFVLRALRALRPCDPLNGSVIG